MRNDAEAKQLRFFGYLIAGAFAFLALWPMVYGRHMRSWSLLVCGVFLVLSGLFPTSLRLPYKAWMMLGEGLGWLNSRIILSVVFYGMFVPMGFIMRLGGRDPMRRRYEPESDSYRVMSARRPGSHMLRQF